MTDHTHFTSYPRTLWALLLARAVNRLGAFTLAFLAVVLVDAYDASPALAGAVVAGFGVATIPSRLLGGRLADRWGRRATIATGLLGCAAAQTAVAAAPSLWVAAVAAIALGLVFEIYEPPTQALVAEVVPERLRARAYSLLGATLAIAGVLAGLVAAVLAGVDLRLLLVADAVTSALCGVVVLAVLPTEPPSGWVAKRGPSPWRDRRLLAMLASGTGFATLYMVVLVGLPLSLGARGIPTSAAGLLLALSAVVLLAGRRLPQPTDPFRAMALGYLALALGLVVAATATTLTGYALAVAVWTLGDVVLLGQPFAVVAALTGAETRGAYLAAYGVSWGIATVLAPLLCTQVLTHAGPGLLWGSAATAALCLAAIQPAVARICRPSSAAVPSAHSP